MRINKYIASRGLATRRDADELVKQGRVTINGRRAVLGDKVVESDKVEVRVPAKTYRYFAYHKPGGILTHSAQEGEEDIAGVTGLKGLFPVGRLDKDSHGLIILTDDGRVTEALLNPEHEHEKEYEVRVSIPLPKVFKRRMERGLDIGGYRTKPCKVSIHGERKFGVILTEGKKHQIRRMCGALGQSVVELKRVRIMNIKLGSLAQGKFRALGGAELQGFLSALSLAR